MKKKREFAAYVGDEFKGLGTIQEIAEIMNVSIKTVYYYRSPAFHKRVGENGIRIIEIELDDEE